MPAPAVEPVVEPVVAPEPVAVEAPVVAPEPLVVEPVAPVEQPPVVQDGAEAWFVADVQEPAAPAEPSVPQTDTWSGRPIGS
jgi:hypothetical protein